MRVGAPLRWDRAGYATPLAVYARPFASLASRSWGRTKARCSGGSGRSFHIDVIDLVRVADEQIVEHWNVVDIDGPMAQLGAVAT